MFLEISPRRIGFTSLKSPPDKTGVSKALQAVFNAFFVKFSNLNSKFSTEYRCTYATRFPTNFPLKVLFQV